ncbi:hypothetical protein LSH36_61g00027 [Paralvinella palmiformis]|uniref:Uncharacterized protein n=1 Tax=Paralvinella palmiformis TaxID=53620 RepID=A0AAD9K455_9ANNE|nr:hypothetical protein LSH36_61g00027 [Paralvinella palmiformis]
MDVLKVVEQWILLHAAKKKYARVLHCFSRKVTEPLSEWLPPCALETFVLYQIVHTRDVPSYETAMSIVLGLHPAISDHIKPCVVTKIVDAMKVVTSDLRERLTRHCAEYRGLFLSLSANPEYCQMYMTHSYNKHFGEKFEARLLELVQRVVAAVENKLPVSPIEKSALFQILNDDSKPSFSDKLSEFKLAAMELLLDYCIDREQLSEDDCIKLLDRLKPSLPSSQHLCHVKSR